MQFSCDSCKALLQISDEKLRGKRLVVKCKRCGSRIQIADPALGTPNRVEPVMATPRSVTTVSGVPTAPDSDTECTRAIDTDHDGTISKDEFVAYAGKKFDTMKKTDNMVSVTDMAKSIARGNTNRNEPKAKTK